jgi:hypothetical protein
MGTPQARMHRMEARHAGDVVTGHGDELAALRVVALQEVESRGDRSVGHLQRVFEGARHAEQGGHRRCIGRFKTADGDRAGPCARASMGLSRFGRWTLQSSGLPSAVKCRKRIRRCAPGTLTLRPRRQAAQVQVQGPHVGLVQLAQRIEGHHLDLAPSARRPVLNIFMKASGCA